MKITQGNKTNFSNAQTNKISQSFSNTSFLGIKQVESLGERTVPPSKISAVLKKVTTRIKELFRGQKIEKKLHHDDPGIEILVDEAGRLVSKTVQHKDGSETVTLL